MHIVGNTSLLPIIGLIYIISLKAVKASICRNLTDTRFITYTETAYSTQQLYPLVELSCEVGRGTCTVPRSEHTYIIERTLSIPVSTEDEDAIFELARIIYWTQRAPQNRSQWDQEWIDQRRVIDTRTNNWNDTFFTVWEGLDYTLSVCFCPFLSPVFFGCFTYSLCCAVFK